MMEEVWEFDDVPQTDQPNSDKKELDIAPPIIRPEYAVALIDAINQLDYFAFHNLAKTCRYLHDICWNTKGIKIPFNCDLEVNNHGFLVTIKEKSHLPRRSRTWCVTRPQFERILKKKNFFYIQLESIHFRVFDEASMARTNEHLKIIGCEITEKLWVGYVSLEMESKMIQFVKDLRVKEFRCDSPLLEEPVSNFIKKMPPRLHLMGDEHFSFYNSMKVLKSWGNFDFEIDEWSLGRGFHLSGDLFMDDYPQHFEHYEVLELFQYPLPSVRPLLLLKWDDLSSFLLRGDGQILEIAYSMNEEKGLFLRRMNYSQLRQKLPMLLPTTE